MDFEADYRFVLHGKLQIRFPFVPVRGLFIGVGGTENRGLIKMLAYNLHTDGKAIGVKTTGQRKGR